MPRIGVRKKLYEIRYLKNPTIVKYDRQLYDSLNRNSMVTRTEVFTNQKQELASKHYKWYSRTSWMQEGEAQYFLTNTTPYSIWFFFFDAFEREKREEGSWKRERVNWKHNGREKEMTEQRCSLGHASWGLAKREPRKNHLARDVRC